jgi:S-adenosylmethionine synthetase
MSFDNYKEAGFSTPKAEGELSFNQETYDKLHQQITDAINTEDPIDRVAALETLVAQYGTVLESVNDIESEVSEEFLNLVVTLTRLLKLEQAKQGFDVTINQTLNS